MKILVTGANGQVGHELLRALAKERIPLDRAPCAFASVRPSQAEGEEVHTPFGTNGGPQGRARRAAPQAQGDEVARSKSHPPRSPFASEGGRSAHPLPQEGGRRVAAGGWTAREIVPATRDGTLEDSTICERVDLADLDALSDALDRIAPDLIVNAAAYTAVDRAEDEPELAMRVNADAVGALGAWVAQHDSRVVHYSTDYVFDGSATHPYREDDATHPLGVYGRSKLAGERALRESGARHLILRTAWVYGARGHNFLRTMLRLAAERDELRVVDDQVGAPTSAGLIADMTARVVARWFDPGEDADGRTLDGTYHLVAAGQTSWCGFARAIFERVALVNASDTQRRATPLDRAPRAFASLRPSLAKGEAHPLPQEGGRCEASGGCGSTPRITAIATADYPTKAKRPSYSVLDTSKLRETFGIELPDWQTALDDVTDKLVRTGS